MYAVYVYVCVCKRAIEWSVYDASIIYQMRKSNQKSVCVCLPLNMHALHKIDFISSPFYSHTCAIFFYSPQRNPLVSIANKHIEVYKHSFIC